MASTSKTADSSEVKSLVATYPILYHSHQYAVGDTLPVNDTAMVEAWIEAGTAVWSDGEEKSTAAKAVPKTAEPGLSGKAAGSETDGDDLVGKVPKTPARKKK